MIADTDVTDCDLCYSFQPCRQEGDQIICIDRVGCQARCDAFLDEPAAEFYAQAQVPAEPPPHATIDEAIRLALEWASIPLPDEERYSHAAYAQERCECAICYSLQPCNSDGEAWICIDRDACSRRQAENRTPASDVPAPLSPVEALRLALDRGVFGLETRARLMAALKAADADAITRAEQLAAARQHVAATWETWQEERAQGAPF